VDRHSPEQWVRSVFSDSVGYSPDGFARNGCGFAIVDLASQQAAAQFGLLAPIDLVHREKCS
jgi:hypothetical protein